MVVFALIVVLPGAGFFAGSALGEAGRTATPKLVQQASHLRVPPLTGEFAVPKELRPAVEFWKSVFGRYTDDEAIVHHAYHLGVVYSVLDFRDLAGNPRASRIRKSRTRAEIDRVRAILRKLHQTRSREKLNANERRIYDLFEAVPGRQKFREAAQRNNIHVQSGISNRFRTGLAVSRRYLPEIEQIFRASGLPLQLTRMPLVESTFNIDARSKAGASGIWQFIPSTGRLYMKVGRSIDERNDPIFASRAATKLLRYNYSETGRWPLAVTAYNHGLGGVKRAVRVTGSRDIVKIIKRYRGARFGYASRNFFVELLAAIEVEQEYKRYFGEIRFEKPFSYDEFRLQRPVLARNLIKAGLSPSDLDFYNPALTSRARSNRLQIPAGMIMRSRVGRGESVVASLNAMSASELPSLSTTTVKRHRVRRGESLSSVSKRYGIRRTSLARANGISSRAHLRIGQRLKVPVRVRTKVTRAKLGASNQTAVLLRSMDSRGPDGGGNSVGDAPTRVASKEFDATARVLEGHGSRETPSPDRPTAAESRPIVRPAPPTHVPAPPRPPLPVGEAPIPSTQRAARPPGPLSSPGAATGPPSERRLSAEKPASAPAAKAKTPAPGKSGATHIVKRNETLWSISKRYRVTVTGLKAANRGSRLSPLIPGTRLQIPASTTHVVRRNETLWGIAKRYRVSLTRLKRANSGKRLVPLLPGTQLRIPG